MSAGGWLNYRTFGLNRPFQLTWPQLYRQFGSNPARATEKNAVHDFRKDCLRELKKIKDAWPGLDYATPAGVLLIQRGVAGQVVMLGERRGVAQLPDVRA